MAKSVWIPDYTRGEEVFNAVSHITGGLFYTGGLFFYGIKKRYFHSVWHLFVLLGTITRFVSVFEIVFTR